MRFVFPAMAAQGAGIERGAGVAVVYLSREDTDDGA
jgi:hypothetical protein